MGDAAKRLLEQALALPEVDRRHLAERLLDSVDDADPAALESAWNEEATRRAAALERGELHPLDGEEALSALERRLRDRPSG